MRESRGDRKKERERVDGREGESLGEIERKRERGGRWKRVRESRGDRKKEREGR